MRIALVARWCSAAATPRGLTAPCGHRVAVRLAEHNPGVWAAHPGDGTIPRNGRERARCGQDGPLRRRRDAFRISSSKVLARVVGCSMPSSEKTTTTTCGPAASINCSRCALSERKTASTGSPHSPRRSTSCSGMRRSWSCQHWCWMQWGSVITPTNRSQSCSRSRSTTTSLRNRARFESDRVSARARRRRARASSHSQAGSRDDPRPRGRAG